MHRRDFTSARSFPGTPRPGGNPAVRAARWIETRPAPLFALALATLAWVGGRGNVAWSTGLFAFMCADWLLIALLPRFGISFGAIQPQTLTLAILRTGFALLPQPWAVTLEATGTVLAVYGFWIEPRQLVLTHQRLRSGRFPAGPPLRMLQFGDLHIERVTDRERRLLRIVADQKPDLIVFTGDFLSTSRLDDPEAHAACRWVFARLAAPLGVLVVSGSPAVDREATIDAMLAGLPMRWLRDETVRIPHGDGAFDVIGLSCTHKPFVDGPRLLEVLGARDHGLTPFTILLYHSPDLAPEAAESGIDLMLSGHTHGGQVRLPGFGALVTSSLYGKRFEVGRIAVGATTLYVSRGMGLEGTGAPHVRFLCAPEVVLWEIEAVSTPRRSPGASPAPK